RQKRFSFGFRCSFPSSPYLSPTEPSREASARFSCLFVRFVTKCGVFRTSVQDPRWTFSLPRKTDMNCPGLDLSGCHLYRGMEKSSCDPPRVFLRLPTTTLRTTLIRRSAQGIGIDFRRAMFLMNLMRTRLLFTQSFPRIQATKVRLLSHSNDKVI